MNKILFYFLLFIIYSFLGWVIEVTHVALHTKKIINRGFLLGPIIPIYGFSSVIMVLYLSNYKDNPLTIFLLAVTICSFIEYMVSYIMEKIFDARWWDYSNRKFNVNGRICLTNAFLFGVLSLLLIYIINPYLESIILKLDIKFLNTITFILLVLFIIDFIISNYVTFKLKDDIKKLQKDITEELKEKIKDKIENTILNKRIFSAYPKYKNNMFQKYYKSKLLKKVEQIKDNIKSKANL